MNTTDVSSLTFDDLFNSDNAHNSVTRLSEECNKQPKHYQYGLYLEIMNHQVRDGGVNICNVSKAVSRLFSNHPDIEICSDTTFHTQNLEKPFKRTFTYPFENIPEYFDGHLLIRFNSHFRDAYALCKFLDKLSNAIKHQKACFIWVEYKVNSDDEYWRYIAKFNSLNYIHNSFRHSEIHINITEPQKAYIITYLDLNNICEHLFNDKIQTYKSLKRVFDNCESPYYYSNAKICAASIASVNDYLVSELFITEEFSRSLSSVEVDLNDLLKKDEYNVGLYIARVYKEQVSRYPVSEPKMYYVAKEISNGTFKVRPYSIHVYRTKENAYMLSACLGLFVDNDYENSLSYLIISVTGEMHRKSNSFAKSLNEIFGSNCRDEINKYIMLLKRKQ